MSSVHAAAHMATNTVGGGRTALADLNIVILLCLTCVLTTRKLNLAVIKASNILSHPSLDRNRLAMQSTAATLRE